MQKYLRIAERRDEAIGSFSNGTEGDGFYQLWCARCVHDAPSDAPSQCTIWMLHLCHNSDQHKKGMVELHKGKEVHAPTLKVMLDTLISCDARGAQTCTMFVPRADARVTGGEAWCESFRHRQRLDERNAGVPCLFCMAENGSLHLEQEYADAP